MPASRRKIKSLAERRQQTKNATIASVEARATRKERKEQNRRLAANARLKRHPQKKLESDRSSSMSPQHIPVSLSTVDSGDVEEFDVAEQTQVFFYSEFHT